MATSMHTWDDDTNRFAHAVIDYAVERVHLAKDTQWGAHPADVLQESVAWKRCVSSARCCCPPVARWTIR